MFSDSKITLAWIQGEESGWNTFVANRVKLIKEAVPAENGFYVNTKNNPADLASCSKYSRGTWFSKSLREYQHLDEDSASGCLHFTAYKKGQECATKEERA